MIKTIITVILIAQSIHSMACNQSEMPILINVDSVITPHSFDTSAYNALYYSNATMSKLRLGVMFFTMSACIVTLSTSESDPRILLPIAGALGIGHVVMLLLAGRDARIANGFIRKRKMPRRYLKYPANTTAP